MTAFRLCALAALLALQGCDSLIPRETSSRIAEGAWQAIDAVDTAQTMQFVSHPTCYFENDRMAATLYGGRNPQPARVALTNIALMLVHARVSTWLDDKVSLEASRDDGDAGPWYVTRIAWHTVSLLASGASVANNYSRGITPTSTRCPE